MVLEELFALSSQFSSAGAKILQNPPSIDQMTNQQHSPSEIRLPRKKEIVAPADVSALINKWIIICDRFSAAHRNEHIALRQLHFRIGAPGVALSAIVGTSIFAALNEAATSFWLKLVLAVLSMSASALAALVTFFKFGERSAAHRMAAEEYEDTGRQLEVLKTSLSVMAPSDWRNVLQGYSQRLESIGRRVDIPIEVTVPAELSDDERLMETLSKQQGGADRSELRQMPPLVGPVIDVVLENSGFEEELNRVFKAKRPH